MSEPTKYHVGKFPPRELRWEVLIPHLGPAAAAVARYDGILAAIPNANVLLSPLVTQEAVLSSRIEGTQATMGEILEFEADASPVDLSEARRADINEVLNYRKAMRLAEEMLKNLPLSLRVVRELHRVLLDGVRGQGKDPGEFRRIPNWIGSAGCSIEHARFVPISADGLPDAMSTWERYIHEGTPDKLVHLAVLHAEFEALHPFLDGNGRLGRMLVPLFLWQQGLIRQPMFYVSAYLEANRETYYDRLLAVSRDNDWSGWCAFFLEGVRDQAEDNLQKAQSILGLYEELKPKAVECTHSQYAILALDWIFSRPIFRSTDFVSTAQIPEATARRLLTEFKKESILRVVTPGKGRRAAILSFPRLLNIAEGREVF
jgi:Fic family protein